MELLLEKLEEIFTEGGILSRIFPGYQPRVEQSELSKRLLRSFYEGNHLLAEAGTGTGKSFAYLMAASLWALENEGTVLISTNTIPLQQQLIDKDLIVVEKVMKQLGYDELRYELAKGRAHYICKRRLENLVQATMNKENPNRDLIEKIAIYSLDAKTGSRDEFPFTIPQEIWEDICGDSDDCFHQHSPFYESCFIQGARRSWSKAHLIVANHALVFSDIALKISSENGVLPKYDRLVFDEGHRVEEVFSRFFERTVSLPEMEKLFRMIRQRKQGWMRNVIDEEVLAEVETFHRIIRDRMQPVFERLADDLSLAQQRAGHSHLSPAMELLEGPLELPVDYDDPIQLLGKYLKGIGELKCGEEHEKRGMQTLVSRILAMSHNLHFVTNREGGDDWAHWIEKVPPQQAGLLDPQAEWVRCIAQPISAHTVLTNLFAQVPVSFLSATMATGKSFSFIATRLGLKEFDEFIADSPFNYKQNALLVVSETAPDPRNADEFEAFLVEGLKRVLKMTQGRTLVLFTSYYLLEKVGELLEDWASEEGIELLLHLPQTDRDALIREFKEGSNRVLFGCDSFWEGIDLPGEALSCVVITKLPFANPSDPLVKAKIKAIEHRGGNSFGEYMIPTAILKTKQGFGRLIRTMEDRGSVIIMDSRVLKRHYGRQILSSLPPARRGKIKEVRLYL